MITPWIRISEDFDPEIAPTHSDVIVIGSGYGGGVAASRLSRAGRTVTLLERGREIGPGAYPRTMKDGLDQVQITVGKTGDHVGPKDGLYDLRLGKDMSVFVGCGLGGTSLINANVAVEPDDAIYAHWPKGVNAGTLAPYFQRARDMLGSQPYPADKTLPKLQALETVAKGLAKRSDKDITFDRADINVTFRDGPNAANVLQSACNNCGDCVTGCNYRAKNTVLMNYLPDAVAFGARLFAGAPVTHISFANDRWHVHIDGHAKTLTADTVVLAAGTLGTTEILKRSESKALTFSTQLGQQFSGNGDVWAFGYNANMPARTVSDKKAQPAPIYGIGAGPHAPDEGPAFAPGPCITGMIRMKGKDLKHDIMIEEGVMPGALAAGYAGAFPMMDALMGDPLRFGDVTRRLEDAKTLGDTLRDDPSVLPDTAYEGPLSRTMPFLVMSHDDNAGELTLNDHHQITVNWENAGLDPAIVNDAKAIKAACDAIQAEYLPLPIWQDAFGNRLVTVHPIGGCAMGNCYETGAINAENQVFKEDGTLHPGLFVCDGAALPGGVGVNPHLTITAVAERAMDILIKKNSWQYHAEKAPVRAAAPTEPEPAQIDWTATLGTVAKVLEKINDDFEHRPLRCARYRIMKAWRRFVMPKYHDYVRAELQTDHPIAAASTLRTMLKAKALREIAAPIVTQCLEIVRPLKKAIDENDFGKVLAIIEAQFGDISPPVFFHEKMTGQISAVGVHDDPQPSEPYAVAAQSGTYCILEADIHADSTTVATTPPDATAQIGTGHITSDAIGGRFNITSGQFHFLRPVPHEVEGWEMRYTGTLAHEDDPTRTLTFDAFKIIRRRAGSHWWTDLTELRIDICDGTTCIARGILNLSVEDLVSQAQTLTFAFDDADLQTAFKTMYRAFADATPRDLPAVFEDKTIRRAFLHGFAYALATEKTRPADALEGGYRLKTFGRMAALTLRNYGGLFSYMADLQGQKTITASRPTEFTVYRPVTPDGAELKLTRYNPGGIGPVILAGGFGTKASSFALPTVEKNIVEMLVKANYDVWLFDYRGSGDILASQTDFTLDSVARHDWPTAITTVLEETGADSVQALVHCIGSVSLFMAMLRGEKRVRSVISSQIAVDAITNWYKFAQSDANLTRYIKNGLPPQMRGLIDMMGLPDDLQDVARNGLKVVDPRSPSPLWATRDDPQRFDAAINGLVWNVPDFAPTPCYSPTCHRITFIFGPSYEHHNLNQATHLAIGDLFGPVAVAPFAHIAQIFRTGHVVDASGADIYRPNVANLQIPIHFIAGAANQEMLPEATLRTQRWLQEKNPSHATQYTRHVYQGYGHMDCFIGKDASAAIFPHLLDKLALHT